MKSLTDNQTFNRPDKIIEGWYWAMRSSELKKGVTAPLNFLGRELVVYRGENGRVVALDAYCPHMGAHLAEGKVEGDSIRCLFHARREAEAVAGRRLLRKLQARVGVGSAQDFSSAA